MLVGWPLLVAWKAGKSGTFGRHLRVVQRLPLLLWRACESVASQVAAVVLLLTVLVQPPQSALEAMPQATAGRERQHQQLQMGQELGR